MLLGSTRAAYRSCSVPVFEYSSSVWQQPTLCEPAEENGRRHHYVPDDDVSLEGTFLSSSSDRRSLTLIS